MGSPVPQSEEYIQARREVTDICIELAEKYGLKPIQTTERFWDEAYTLPNTGIYTECTMTPPIEGAILFRDEESDLVAILEITPRYEGDSGQFTDIEQLKLGVFRHSYQYRDFASDFYTKYGRDRRKIEITRIQEELIE